MFSRTLFTGSFLAVSLGTSFGHTVSNLAMPSTPLTTRISGCVDFFTRLVPRLHFEFRYLFYILLIITFIFRWRGHFDRDVCSNNQFLLLGGLYYSLWAHSPCVGESALSLISKGLHSEKGLNLRFMSMDPHEYIICFCVPERQALGQSQPQSQ